jgi:signal recognition particle subunit SEC65
MKYFGIIHVNYKLVEAILTIDGIIHLFSKLFRVRNPHEHDINSTMREAFYKRWLQYFDWKKPKRYAKHDLTPIVISVSEVYSIIKDI